MTITSRVPITACEIASARIASGPLPRTRPVYRHISQAIERGITAGTLALDFRLPAERELADALKVSRTTICALLLSPIIR